MSCSSVAGPANLTAAYTLAKRLKDAGRDGEFTIMVIEKGKSVGDHILSGAVMDPRGMDEAWGKDWRARGCPVEADVVEEKVFSFTASDAKPLPFIPPTLDNHGNVIVALSKVVGWMKTEVEQLGVMVAEGQPAAEPIIHGAVVTGVHLVDAGRNPDGSEGDGFMPGAAVDAKVTVFGEGSRGSWRRRSSSIVSALSGPNPQVYGTGVKELWRFRRDASRRAPCGIPPGGRFPTRSTAGRGATRNRTRASRSGS
jgi:electron-transferring-flavoprotein dehydrogenase